MRRQGRGVPTHRGGERRDRVRDGGVGVRACRGLSGDAGGHASVQGGGAVDQVDARPEGLVELVLGDLPGQGSHQAGNIHAGGDGHAIGAAGRACAQHAIRRFPLGPQVPGRVSARRVGGRRPRELHDLRRIGEHRSGVVLAGADRAVDVGAEVPMAQRVDRPVDFDKDRDLNLLLILKVLM